jgi:AcrR family transcriptional regulator
MATRTAYHHGHLRAVLLTAALRALRRGGPSALSLRALAREAGVSSAAPYRHFRTKTALLDALAAEGYARLLGALGQSLEQHPGLPRRQFHAAAQVYVRFADTHPEWLRLMLTHRPLDRNALRTLVVTQGSGFLELIRAGQARGIVAPGDPTDLTVAAFAFLHGLSSLRLELLFREPGARNGARSAWLPRLVDWFWFGLARRPGGRAARAPKK